MTLEEFLDEWNNDSERVLVHTSGSTGAPKPLWVEKRRMESSARITCDFLGLKEGDTALLCMPLDYIAGNLANPSATDNLYQKLTAEIEDICERPYSFPDCSPRHKSCCRRPLENC